MSGLLLSYVVRNADDDLQCSQCDEEAHMLARLPLKGFIRGWRRLLGKSTEAPWIGLCETCVHRLMDGFAQARQQGEDTKT